MGAVEASGTEMITVAIRRLDLDDPTQKTLLDYIDWDRYQILPNTAAALPSRRPCSLPAWAVRWAGPPS